MTPPPRYVLRTQNRSSDRDRPREPEPAPEPEPVLEDINRCRVPREFLERWANEPYFEKAVKGCFIRVARGQGRNGERVYVMAEIVGVVPYKRRYKIVSGSAVSRACGDDTGGWLLGSCR